MPGCLSRNYGCELNLLTNHYGVAFRVVNYFPKISTVDVWLGFECAAAQDQTTHIAAKTILENIS